MAALSNREKAAAWRKRQRVVCPCCGDDVRQLNERTGWCWICTRQHDTEQRHRADAAVVERRARPAAPVPPDLFVASPLGFSHRVNGRGALYAGVVYRTAGTKPMPRRAVAAKLENNPAVRYEPTEVDR